MKMQISNLPVTPHPETYILEMHKRSISRPFKFLTISIIGSWLRNDDIIIISIKLLPLNHTFLRIETACMQDILRVLGEVAAVRCYRVIILSQFPISPLSPKQRERQGKTKATHIITKINRALIRTRYPRTHLRTSTYATAAARQGVQVADPFYDGVGGFGFGEGGVAVGWRDLCCLSRLGGRREGEGEERTVNLLYSLEPVHSRLC